MSILVRIAELKVGDFIEVKFKKPIAVVSITESPKNPGQITITTVSETGKTTESLYSSEDKIYIRNRSPFKFYSQDLHAI